jgi:hypothetical protein
LLSGRVILRMSHAAAQPYVIDTPASPVRLEAEGEYSVSVRPAARLEVAVSRGAASVSATREWPLRGGQMLTLPGAGSRPWIETFNTAQVDAFAAWSRDRADRMATATSASQLPYELRAYGPALDRDGRWDYVEPEGYVWFPSVSADWRPYYDGSWAFTRYGWTWHGHDRWAWPTHHYGRWGYNGAFWYWVPATSWAPAWVTWSVSPGYVSWAPYGWHHGRFDAWGRRDHPAYGPGHNAWRGWTVLPRNHFGPRRNVRAHAVDAGRLDDATRRALLNRATPPTSLNDVAVPRNSVRVPGSRGNVRRPVPPVPSSRVSPGDRARGGAGDPAYVPPSSFGGAAERARSPREGPRADEPRTRAPRDAGSRAPRDPGTRAPRDTGDRSPRSGAGSAAEGARSGAVRRPGAQSAPRSAPRSSPPSAGGPKSGDGARGAVPRSGANRRPGG